MAASQSYLASLKTGSGMNYPIVMKSPYCIEEYMIRVEVKDDDEIAIGDLIIVDANLLADAVGGAKATNVFAIVLDTNHNKAVLEGHGLTVNKTSQFKDGDFIDILPLLPGVIVSVKCEASSTVNPGTRLVSSDTAGAVQVYADTPAAILGMSVTQVTSGSGTSYIGMLVK